MSRPPRPPARRKRWLALAGRETVALAVDTEYHGPDTLTIQFAARTGEDEITVQLYHSPQVSRFPHTRCNPIPIRTQEPGRGHSAPTRIVVRPPRRITTDLSPARVLLDLFGIGGVDPVGRIDGDRLLAEHAASEVGRPGAMKPPRLRINVFGHHLEADFARSFGSSFYGSLFVDDRDRSGRGAVMIQARPQPGLVANYMGSRRPVVEYVADADQCLTAIILDHIDTNRMFDGGSLDEVARGWLGCGKVAGPTEAQLRDMASFFRDHPLEASTYAIRDAALTLLLAEAMQREDRAICEVFTPGAAADAPMNSTVGRRGKTVLELAMRRHAATSQALAKHGALNDLIRGGSGHRFRGVNPLSRMGEQTATSHGGLVFSRTSERLWHESPGQIRDVDVKGFYNQITSGIDVYLGEPTVIDPGEEPTTLREAVGHMNEHCPHDGWYLRVTGPVTGWDNTLIPSTVDALTHSNFRRRMRRPDAKPLVPRGRLYTREVESGIVTAATWDLIRCLPDAARQQYEGLRVESMVFYHSRLIASDGARYDELVSRLGLPTMPFVSWYDFGELLKTTVERASAQHACLRFPLREVAGRVGEERRRARAENLPTQEHSWKLVGNVFYGILANRRSPRGNVVAANVITAAGRALAWCLITSLNGFQVVTDGCTYRRDQIPRVTLAECLRLQPDYLTRRADEDGPIPFYDSDEVPVDDQEFTRWIRGHLGRFLGQVGDTPGGEFSFEHKQHGGLPAFDALICDGMANDVKLAVGSGQGRWKILKTSRRGYDARARRKIAKWLISVARHDRIEEPPPALSSSRLLTLDAAVRATGRALKERRGRGVLLPLGFERRTMIQCRLISESAFLYTCPRQHQALTRQIKKFGEKHGSFGLEVLALRRGYKGRPTGSVRGLLRKLARFIREGGKDLDSEFHLSRPFAPETKKQLDEAAVVFKSRKARFRRKFATSMKLNRNNERRPQAGIWCDSPEQVPKMQQYAV